MLDGKEGQVKAMPLGEQEMHLSKEAKVTPPGSGDQTKEAAALADRQKKERDASAQNNALNNSAASMAYLMGNAQQQNIAALNAGEISQNNLTAQQLHDLVNSLVDHLSSVTTAKQTDTTITIQNLPLFNGAVVTIHSYPTARGEINITFENLTQQGKNILDMVDNRAALKQALDQKGYTVHMITTTTSVIERTYTEGSNPYKEGRGGDTADEQSDREQQEQQQQQQKKQK